MQVGSLYAGIGGIEKGFQSAGFEISWANEYDEKACKTYKLNFDTQLFEEDVNTLDFDKLRKVDVLTAGFPCQPFSIAGLQKGFYDQRGNHFFTIAALIQKQRPLVVFLENVRNLTAHDNGNTMRVILETLHTLGYNTHYKVMSSDKYGGIPQTRSRIYMVAFREKEHFEKFKFPKEIPNIPLSDFLEDSSCVPKKYYYDANNGEISRKIIEGAKDIGEVYQWRRIYLRQNKKGHCPTLTANMGTGGHNVPIIRDTIGVRKLMPIECFALQGFPTIKFPEKMSDSALYKQAGNSVTCSVIYRIANEINDAIK